VNLGNDLDIYICCKKYVIERYFTLCDFCFNITTIWPISSKALEEKFDKILNSEEFSIIFNKDGYYIFKRN